MTKPATLTFPDLQLLVQQLEASTGFVLDDSSRAELVAISQHEFQKRQSLTLENLAASWVHLPTLQEFAIAVRSAIPNTLQRRMAEISRLAASLDDASGRLYYIHLLTGWSPGSCVDLDNLLALSQAWFPMVPPKLA